MDTVTRVQILDETLHFPKHLYSWEKYESNYNYSLSKYGQIVGQTGFSSFD